MKKIAITLNDDGHFLAAQIDNRTKCISILKSVDDGQYWEDYLEDALYACGLKEEDLLKCTLDRFEQFLSWFETRGDFEVVEI